MSNSSTNEVFNSLNISDYTNCLAIGNTDTSTLDEQPYFIAFQFTKNSSGVSSSYPNFIPIDITFYFSSTDTYKVIYPFIRCAQETGPDPYVTLSSNSKYLFTKISS
jgi:hypothetical protein